MKALENKQKQPETKGINKTDIIRMIAKQTGLKKEKAKSALRAFIEITEETLKKGDKLTLPGFGTFATKKRAKRTGVNPRTGKKIKISTKAVPFFKPGKKLVEVVARQNRETK